MYIKTRGVLCVNIWLLLLEKHHHLKSPVFSVNTFSDGCRVDRYNVSVLFCHPVKHVSEAAWSTARNPDSSSKMDVGQFGNNRNHQSAAAASLMRNQMLLIDLMLISVYKRHQPSPNRSSARLHTDSQIYRPCRGDTLCFAFPWHCVTPSLKSATSWCKRCCCFYYHYKLPVHVRPCVVWVHTANGTNRAVDPHYTRLSCWWGWLTDQMRPFQWHQHLWKTTRTYEILAHTLHFHWQVLGSFMLQSLQTRSWHSVQRSPRPKIRPKALRQRAHCRSATSCGRWKPLCFISNSSFFILLFDTKKRWSGEWSETRRGPQGVKSSPYPLLLPLPQFLILLQHL